MLDTATLETIKRRQRLSEEYASYSQTRGGLSKVLGGVVGTLVILTGTLLGGGVVTAFVTIIGTLVWLIGKEVIRTRFDRPFGEAQEEWSPEKRREQRYLAIFLAGVSIFVFAAYIVSGHILNPQTWSYLFFAALIAPVTWRFFRTPAEGSVGIFLMAACAVHSVGGAYSLFYRNNMDNILLDVGMMAATWTPLLFAGVLVLQGIAEHRRFRALASELGA